jgi:hypothetical protein
MVTATKTTKTKTKVKAAKSSVSKIEKADRIDPYKKLLARVAGDAASGAIAGVLARGGAFTAKDVEVTAAIVLDVAEEILKKIGIEPTMPIAETPADA